MLQVAATAASQVSRNRGELAASSADVGSCCTKSPAREVAAIINCWAGNRPTCMSCLSYPAAQAGGGQGADAEEPEQGVILSRLIPPHSILSIPGKIPHHHTALAVKSRRSCFCLVCHLCSFFLFLPGRQADILAERALGIPIPNSNHRPLKRCSPAPDGRISRLGAPPCPTLLAKLPLPAPLNAPMVRNTTSDK